MTSRPPIDATKPLTLVPRLIFASRWLQLPLIMSNVPHKTRPAGAAAAADHH